MNNQMPQTVDDFILLLQGVREKYGNVKVKYVSDSDQSNPDEFRDFEDVVYFGGAQSLVRSNNVPDESSVVFVVW